MLNNHNLFNLGDYKPREFKSIEKYRVLKRLYDENMKNIDYLIDTLKTEAMTPEMRKQYEEQLLERETRAEAYNILITKYEAEMEFEGVKELEDGNE